MNDLTPMQLPRYLEKYIPDISNKKLFPGISQLVNLPSCCLVILHVGLVFGKGYDICHLTVTAIVFIILLMKLGHYYLAIQIAL